MAAIARGGERVELSADARARNLAARETIAQRLRVGRALYGATTGVGALRDRVITEAERERYQWNLLRSHAVSAGRPLPVRSCGPGWWSAPTSLAPAAPGWRRRCSRG